MVEYADTTLAKDLNIKQKIYAQAGILEYWIVNLQVAELIVFRGANITGYETETRLAEGNISPLSFPDIEIDVRRLFS